MLINTFNCCSCTILSPHPQECVVTPRENPGERELRQENICDINSARTATKNINQCVQTSAIVDGIDRGWASDFRQITKINQVVVALCNLNINKNSKIYTVLFQTAW